MEEAIKQRIWEVWSIFIEAKGIHTDIKEKGVERYKPLKSDLEGLGDDPLGFKNGHIDMTDLSPGDGSKRMNSFFSISRRVSLEGRLGLEKLNGDFNGLSSNNNVFLSLIFGGAKCWPLNEDSSMNNESYDSECGYIFGPERATLAFVFPLPSESVRKEFGVGSYSSNEKLAEFRECIEETRDTISGSDFPELTKLLDGALIDKPFSTASDKEFYPFFNMETGNSPRVVLPFKEWQYDHVKDDWDGFWKEAKGEWEAANIFMDKLIDDGGLKDFCESVGFVEKGTAQKSIKKNKEDAEGKDMSDYRKRLKEVLGETTNVILQGPPGTGKTWATREYIKSQMNDGDEDYLGCNWSQIRSGADNMAEAIEEAKDKPLVWEMVQMHPGYSYEDFVRGMSTEEGSGISFVPRDRVVLELAKVAEEREKAEKSGEVVLIMDEINRCNLASVLGELILVLEEDKRSWAGEGGWPVRLQYPAPKGEQENSDGPFTLPKTLKFVGTMNTADRSIAMIDYAIRRRFRFVDVVPDVNALISYYEDLDGDSNAADMAVEAFKNLSEAVNGDLGPRLRVGHTYFMVDPEGDEVQDLLAEKIVYEVLPLLREYRAEGRLDGESIELGGKEINLDYPDNNGEQERDLKVVKGWFETLGGGAGGE